MSESSLLGKKAPAFSLADQHGEKVSLQDQRGKWTVIYFYPKADTPGCTVQACEFTESIQDFEGMDADVFGVSPDPVDDLAKFAAKYQLQVRLLSDPSKATLKKYGAYGMKKMYGKDVEGVIRSTVLVDPEGKVAHHWPNVKAQGHAAKVKEVLAKLTS